MKLHLFQECKIELRLEMIDEILHIKRIKE